MAQERKNGSMLAHGSNGATFEGQFQRLQEVVQRLSNGNLTLQEALSSFEEGMMLADSCGTMLEQAELRVEQVSDRALRAGQAQAIDLDAAMRAHPVEEESDVLTFESFEATVVFEGPGAGSQGSGGGGGGPKSPSAKGSLRPINGGLVLPLDPLFDEDD